MSLGLLLAGEGQGGVDQGTSQRSIPEAATNSSASRGKAAADSRASESENRRHEREVDRLDVRMAATRQEKAALLARNRESQEMVNKVASQQRKIAALPQKVSLDSASQRTQLQAAFVASMDDFIGVIDQSGSLLQLVAKTK